VPWWLRSWTGYATSFTSEYALGRALQGCIWTQKVLELLFCAGCIAIFLVLCARQLPRAPCYYACLAHPSTHNLQPSMSYTAHPASTEWQSNTVSMVVFRNKRQFLQPMSGRASTNVACNIRGVVKMFTTHSQVSCKLQEQDWIQQLVEEVSQQDSIQSAGTSA
jgi:hypothetical protein